ncbi:hypothetical protein Deba_0472 [Desulfarculus baarsii DSM 2075]|uniref:Uncharacterized protein n=1 Tax=Desulfarculus baarsii (strain ATCC 33931 / DSM 2075 / LMG 7858 / VKM B-1802 / 2st14) TaxID=644282 RepID=E1QE59_DESB2|nr:hypothetical protein [Desulfarculus baarsii]ADK83845.1 hypothetical protein Deba_0472 [Desulfarculus baarsii DSM 2075]
MMSNKKMRQNNSRARRRILENSGWFVAGMLAMALVWLQLGARPGVAADPEGVITAQSFRLVDDNGVVRGVLGFSREEYPMLVLCDNTGNKQAIVCSEPDGPSIYLESADYKPMVIIKAAHDEGPQVFLMGKKPGSVASLSNMTEPTLALSYASDGPMLGLSTNEVQAAMAINGGPGKGEIGLAVKHDVGSLIFMNNGRDNGQLALGVTPRWTSVMAKDGDDSGLTLAVRKNRAPAMELTENGRAVWSALGGGAVDDAEMRGLFGGAGSWLNFDKLFK